MTTSGAPSVEAPGVDTPRPVGEDLPKTETDEPRKDDADKKEEAQNPELPASTDKPRQDSNAVEADEERRPFSDGGPLPTPQPQPDSEKEKELEPNQPGEPFKKPIFASLDACPKADDLKAKVFRAASSCFAFVVERSRVRLFG